MLAVSGVVLGAWYMLSLVARVFFGPLHQKHEGPIGDLGLREVLALVPLCVVIVWIGIQPRFFLDRMGPASIVEWPGDAPRGREKSHTSERGEEKERRKGKNWRGR